MTAARLRGDWLALVAGFAVVMAVELVLIFWNTDGNFTYTLDDPYIHLALAENLARFGHYGLNIEEYSSPSSSIIWPLLLVPGLMLGLGLYGPLVLNVAFAVLTVLVIHRIIIACASRAKPEASVSWVWALLIFFAGNGFGLVLTGMEHSLHVLVTVCVLYLVLRMQLAADIGGAAPSNTADYLLLSCVVLSPLVRFEGVAISAFAIAMLVRLGRLRLAMLCVLLIAMSLALYFWMMSVLGLPWLPSSVLVKSEAAAAVAGQASFAVKLTGAVTHIMDNISENLRFAEALLLVAVAIGIAALSLCAWRQGGRISPTYVIGVLAVIVLHLVFGKFGWYGRYQAYVFVFAVCAMPYLFFGWLFGGTVTKERLIHLGAFAALTVTLLGVPQYLVPLLTTPNAAQNIYEQQRQMHAFVTRHWKAPVAVNDVGYVGFQNDAYVLDLWGLGSEEARRLRRSGDPDMLNKLTVQHGVHLAMIYEHLFSIPADWRKLAELHLSTDRITPASDRVSFFVFGLDQARCSQVSAQLAEFARALPRPQTLTVDPKACDQPDIPPEVRSAAG